MNIDVQYLFTGFLQQTGQQSGAPGDDKPPGTEDSVDARTASYNAYMQYAYQQWMASQTGQSQSGSGWVNLSFIGGNPLRAYIQLSGKLLQSPSSPTLTVILTGTAAAPATATTPLATVQVEEHQELQEVPSMALRCLEPTMQRWDTATTMAGMEDRLSLLLEGALEIVVERGVPGYFCWVVGHF